MAENKPTNRERLREITDGTEQGIKELFGSEKYMRYLPVMFHFHRYSAGNTMLIYMQKPDTTLIAEYNRRKDQFERHVKKGEHGITIIAPTPYKKKIEEQKLDLGTKTPILDKDGKIVTEEKEIEIPMSCSVKISDASQTDGKPLPELISSFSGNVLNYEAFMEALHRSAPVPITFEAMATDTDGYFSVDYQKIAIRQGTSEVQTVSATVHEIAHSKFHNQKKIQIVNDERYQEIELFDKPGLFFNGRAVRNNLPEGVYCYDLRGSDYDPGELICVEEQVVVNHAGPVLLAEPLELAEDGCPMLTEEEGLNFVGGFSTFTQFLQEQRKDRYTEGVEVESISYAIRKYLGIETGENSFGYIVSQSQGKELKELGASLETINKVSDTLISDIKRHYREICRERGIDPHAKTEPETAPIEQPTGNLTYYVAECMEFPSLGGYHNNLSLEGPVRIYREIPAERMNGIKGIGFEPKDGSDYEEPFPILTGQTINLDTIQTIDYYRDSPLIQKVVKELTVIMSEMEALGADANQQEASFLVSDTIYFRIQLCDSGWDYILYDAASMKELDGDQLDMSELSCMKTILQICDDNDLDSTSLRRAPLSMVETLREATYQQMQAETSQMTASSQLPEAQEQALDGYSMPDKQVFTPDMQEYGYFYDGTLPVTRERVPKLDAVSLTIYMLYEDSMESMVFDPQEIMDYGGLFGVDREEWERSPQPHEKAMECQEHQQEWEQAFLAQNRDCFAIYQVSRDDPWNVRFMNLDWLKSHDISIDRSNYDLIYTVPLRESGTAPEQLEKLYRQFNLEKPMDFHSSSMSVNDIVTTRQDGKVSCHYCDSVGFTQIPGFLPENPLKNAEMAMEDGHGMVDGIINNDPKEPTVVKLEQQVRSGQPISLMDLADAVHRKEWEKKKSVMGQLKGQPKTGYKKAAPKKSAEREI